MEGGGSPAKLARAIEAILVQGGSASIAVSLWTDFTLGAWRRQRRVEDRRLAASIRESYAPRFEQSRAPYSRGRARSRCLRALLQRASTPCPRGYALFRYAIRMAGDSEGLASGHRPWLY